MHFYGFWANLNEQIRKNAVALKVLAQKEKRDPVKSFGMCFSGAITLGFGLGEMGMLCGSRQVGGYRQSRITHLDETIRAWIKEQPDLTLVQLCQRLAQQDIQIKPPALWHQLNKWKLSFKKTLHASEQERSDVQQARHAWRESLPQMDSRRLVFLDETGASTCMTPTCGRSPRGQRCIAAAPHGHWKITTFIAALRCDRLTAPMVIDGPINGPLFLAYVRDFLCPTLQPGDIVVADNLSSHKVAGVRQAIEAVGATIRYLPAYSLDRIIRAPSAIYVEM